MLNSYVQRIKDALASYAWIKSVEFLRFDLTRTDLEKILLYRVRVRLQDGVLLEACERLSETKNNRAVERTKYHFHWQDAAGKLIRRWDNAPHHPELDNFPHHVHHRGPDDDCQPGKSLSLPHVLEQIDLVFRTGEERAR